MRNRCLVLWLSATLVLSSLAGAGILAGSASARDRPGTPKEVSLYKCDQDMRDKAALCLQFTLTNTEPARIEWDVTRNDQPIAPTAFHFVCGAPAAGICFKGTQIYKKPSNGQPNIPLVVKILDLPYNTKYCWRVRARRASDDVVSEIWSGMPCMTTDGPPALPKPIEGKFDFLNSDLRLTYPPNPGNVGEVRVQAYVDGKKDQPEWKTRHSYTSTPRPDIIPFLLRTKTFMIDICGSNTTGQTCTTKLINVDKKDVETPLQHPPTGDRPMTLPVPAPPTGPLQQRNPRLPPGGN